MEKINNIWKKNKAELPVVYKRLNLLNKTKIDKEVDYSRKLLRLKKYPVKFKDDYTYYKEISNIVIDD